MTEIARLLTLPEGKTLEFKRDLSSVNPIIKTIIAFANTAGGTLIIGRDNDGKLLGVEDVFKAEEKISNAIADNVAPFMMPDIEIISVDGKPLIVIRVSYWPMPFYLKAKGVVDGVYFRLGSTNRNAEKDVLEEIHRTKTKVTFDQLPCPDVSVKGLNWELLERAFGKVNKTIDEHKLINLGILVPYGKKLVCSNGGIILFGKNDLRERLFPNSQVRCARFAGQEKVEFIDQYDVEGSILEAVIDVPKFIRRNTRLASVIKSAHRVDVPEFSDLAIREILTNAVVHADYTLIGKHTRVAIFCNRMEIESPGMLPFGYSFEDFISGRSQIRNKVITRTFRELKLMEEWGTGYKRIKEACLAGNYPVPEWKEQNLTFTATLFSNATPSRYLLAETSATFTCESDDFSDRQLGIIDLLKTKGKLTAKALHALLNEDISERTVRMELLNLKTKGFVVSLGKGPSTRWAFTKAKMSNIL